MSRPLPLPPPGFDDLPVEEKLDCVQSTDCFLCSPDHDLLFREDGRYFALAGLGPLVAGYSVVASRLHTRSAADHIDREKLMSFTRLIRTELSELFGSCILGEHGRVPICLRRAGLSESHCYHAHFLLFPGISAIDSLALPYFRHASAFESLEEALSAASRFQDEYYLLSSVPNRYLVMKEPRRPMRQFTRGLVAAVTGNPQLADWEKHPNRDEALQNAAKLRVHFLT